MSGWSGSLSAHRPSGAQPRRQHGLLAGAPHRPVSCYLDCNNTRARMPSTLVIGCWYGGMDSTPRRLVKAKARCCAGEASKPLPGGKPWERHGRYGSLPALARGGTVNYPRATRLEFSLPLQVRLGLCSEQRTKEYRGCARTLRNLPFVTITVLA